MGGERLDGGGVSERFEFVGVGIRRRRQPNIFPAFVAGHDSRIHFIDRGGGDGGGVAADERVGVHLHFKTCVLLFLGQQLQSQFVFGLLNPRAECEPHHVLPHRFHRCPVVLLLPEFVEELWGDTGDLGDLLGGVCALLNQLRFRRRDGGVVQLGPIGQYHHVPLCLGAAEVAADEGDEAVHLVRCGTGGDFDGSPHHRPLLEESRHVLIEGDAALHRFPVQPNDFMALHAVIRKCAEVQDVGGSQNRLRALDKIVLERAEPIGGVVAKRPNIMREGVVEGVDGAGDGLAGNPGVPVAVVGGVAEECPPKLRGILVGIGLAFEGFC